MSFDIYGNNLKRGNCEVHPHVAEEYPCSVCVMENQHTGVAQQSQNETAQLQCENTYLNDKVKEVEGKYQKSCKSWRDLVQVKEDRIAELQKDLQSARFFQVDVVRCLSKIAWQHNHDEIPSYRELSKKCIKTIEDQAKGVDVDVDEELKAMLTPTVLFDLYDDDTKGGTS